MAASTTRVMVDRFYIYICDSDIYFLCGSDNRWQAIPRTNVNLMFIEPFWMTCETVKYESKCIFCIISLKMSLWKWRVQHVVHYVQWPVLLTWYNFNPSMDK